MCKSPRLTPSPLLPRAPSSSSSSVATAGKHTQGHLSKTALRWKRVLGASTPVTSVRFNGSGGKALGSRRNELRAAALANLSLVSLSDWRTRSGWDQGYRIALAVGGYRS